MKSKKALFSVILAFVILLGGAYVLYDTLGQNIAADQLAVQVQSEEKNVQEEAHSAHAEGAEIPDAPDFTVYNAKGNEVRLSSYIGKPIVLNFWASWCGPCQSEMPDFNEKYAELGDDVNFLMVNMTDGARETVDTASAFVEKNGYDFPVFYDTTGQAAMIYGAYSLPTTFFISAEGKVIAQATGAIDAATLQKGIDMISG